MNISTNKLPAPIATGYAEPKEVAPKVALFDDFDGDETGFPHGQAVESVLFSHSDLKDADVQRYQNMPEQARIEQIMRDKKVNFRQAYSAAVMRNTAKFYLTTAQNLQTVVTEQPSVKVISQSQGDSPARLMGDLIDDLQARPELQKHANETFGLKPDASMPELLAEMMIEAEQLIGNNELVNQARQEYLKAAQAVEEKGITYLVAAGNHGELANELAAAGVKANPGAFRNIFANEFATIVGANDAQGNPATLNSPGAGIEVYALGENLPWQAGEGFNRNEVASGTSFATPIIAGQVVTMQAADPSLTPFDIESKLQGLESTRVFSGEIKATPNGQSLIGDGSLEPYISEKIGEGFVTGITGETADQLVQATQPRTFFALPGEEDHEFQLVRVSPDPNGVRTLSVDTYFDEGHHVLRAKAKDGAWDPASVTEELHLDAKRQKEIEARPPAPAPDVNAGS